MSGENTNDNDNGNALTIAQAVKHLNTTEPRLRRLLARPEFAQHLRQEERKTRTGTRTATVIPAGVIVSLQEVLEIGRGTEGEIEPERQRQRERTQENTDEVKSVPVSVPDVSALLEQLQSENAFLRSELTAQREQHAQSESELRRLMLADKRELSELREHVKMLAAPTVVEEPVQDVQDRQSGVEQVAMATQILEENFTPGTIQSSAGVNLVVPVQDMQEGTQETRTTQSETNAVNHPQEAETSVQSEDAPIDATLEKSAPGIVRTRRWWEVWRR